MKYSVLDLATIVKRDTIFQTFEKSVRAAQHVEKLGFTRYWFSEHHNFPNVASAATSILIGHIAGKTTTLRVGSGGIMLPNHSTLSVAEQFGTLDALYPGRIDLGLGRAPGTDMQTAAMLRRGNFEQQYDFEKHIGELKQFMSAENSNASIRAIPGEEANVPLYILGSSTDSAFLAAKLGLPYAFAAHFAPSQLEAAFTIYENNFRPSSVCPKPYKMVCVSIIAAEDDEKAHHLSLSHFQAFINILTDQRQPLAPPEESQLGNMSPELLHHLNRMTACTFIGGAESLKKQLNDFVADLKPDEIIVSGNIFDFEAKLLSYKIASELLSTF